MQSNGVNNMQCRIAVTLDCNLNCSYCCMTKIPDIYNSFTVKYMDDILKTKYDSFVITGGEPTLDLELLFMVINDIHRSQPKAKIYLHTNGVLLTEQFVVDNSHILDGINISIHGEPDYDKYLKINNILPVRLHVWQELVTCKLSEFCEDHNIELKEWTMDDCETIPEDRYILRLW